MTDDRTLPEGLTRAMFDAIRDLREWVTPPPAPDAEVQAWPLFSGWEYGGVYCAKDECGCAAEGSELIRGDDRMGDEAETFTLADLHRRIGGAGRGGGGVMGRGQTTAEFAASHGPNWVYDGGLPGDPGWVSDAAREFGDLLGLDAEALDDAAAEHGWEFHDPGYDEKIQQLALTWGEQ